MPRRIISMLTVAVLTTAGLATGCSGDGRPSAESSPSTRSTDVSPGRSAGAASSRGVSPRARDSAPEGAAETADPGSPEKTATRTEQPAAPQSVERRATQTETQTITQSAAQPVPSTGAESPAPADGESAVPTWLWVLSAVLIIGLIAWIVSAARRRSRVERGWNSRVTDACSQGVALHDAISVAENSGLETSADARWFDIQRRADDLTRALDLLREAAPAEDWRIRVDDVLAALQAVRLAVTPEQPAYANDGARAESIRDRLRTFDYALNALRTRASL